MLSCWHIDPVERPSFETVRSTLENILLNSEEYLELGTENEEWNYGDVNYYENTNKDDSLQQRCSKA